MLPDSHEVAMGCSSLFGFLVDLQGTGPLKQQIKHFYIECMLRYVFCIVWVGNNTGLFNTPRIDK